MKIEKKSNDNRTKNQFFVDILCRENGINLDEEQREKALRGYVFGRYSLQQTCEERKFNALNKESIMERLEFIYNANEINNTSKKEFTKDEIKKEARSIFLYMILSKKPIDKISSMTNPEAYELLKNSCLEYKNGLDVFRKGLSNGKTIDQIRKELNQVTQRDNGEMSEEKNELEPEQEKDTNMPSESEKSRAMAMINKILEEKPNKYDKIIALAELCKKYQARQAELKRQEEEARVMFENAREDLEGANKNFQEAQRRKKEADEEYRRQQENLVRIQKEKANTDEAEEALRDLFDGIGF